MGSYQDKSSEPEPRFTIGRDHHGWWVVQDRLERVGGFFATQDAARHFAAEEADHDASQICVAGDAVELFAAAVPQMSIGRQILENNRRMRGQDDRRQSMLSARR